MLGPQAGGAAMAMQASISHVMHHPLGVFSLLVAISAAVPPLIRRLGLPIWWGCWQLACWWVPTL